MISITVDKTTPFDPKAILTCGQIFRYTFNENVWTVYSKDKRAIISDNGSNYLIEGDEYFYHFFDLDTDYSAIMEALKGKPLLDDAITKGRGIRILNQDLFETLISFIISANNHIPRIKGIIERLSSSLGKFNDGFYSFPSVSALAAQNVEFYSKAGLGYRAPYIVNTSRAVENGDIDLDALRKYPTTDAAKSLQQLSGVGPKVADCILLFAYHKTDVFPVDTWIKKVFHKLTDREASPAEIRQYMLNVYSPYAGIAQQYLFYAERNK